MPTSASSHGHHASYVVMYGEELAQITAHCQQLMQRAGALAVALVDRNGQFITGCGALTHLDKEALASLTAGTAAAAEDLAKLVGEKTFTSSMHEGACVNVHLVPIGERAVVLMLCDVGVLPEHIRPCVNAARQALTDIFAQLQAKAPDAAKNALLETISDDDIDNVFGK